MHGVQSYPAERPVPPWPRQDQPPAGEGDPVSPLVFSLLEGDMDNPLPPEVGLGETMAELAIPRGNFARRELFQLRPLGAL